MSARVTVRSLLGSIRPNHWVKNFLVFLPLVTSHTITDLSLLWTATLSFVAFCLAASGGYIINDLHDLEFDRLHSEKRSRPLAAGMITHKSAALFAVVLMAASAALAWLLLPITFLAALLAYILTSLAYTLIFRQALFLDVIVLTFLYCIRIIAGGAATGYPVSAWLLALSLFLFLSLALLKRYAGLRSPQDVEGSARRSGRGYLSSDSEILRPVGTASGLMSVLLLALYINSDQARTLYRLPDALWLMGPLLIYWVVRMWLLAHRGTIKYDPVVFASRDRTSYIVGALSVVVIYTAATGLGLVR